MVIVFPCFPERLRERLLNYEQSAFPREAKKKKKVAYIGEFRVKHCAHNT